MSLEETGSQLKREDLHGSESSSYNPRLSFTVQLFLQTFSGSLALSAVPVLGGALTAGVLSKDVCREQMSCGLWVSDSSTFICSGIEVKYFSQVKT